MIEYFKENTAINQNKKSSKSSVSDPDSLESGSGSSILAESGSGSRLQKLIDSKGLKC